MAPRRFPIGRASIVVAVLLGGIRLVGMGMSHSAVIRLGLVVILTVIFFSPTFLDYPPLNRPKRFIRRSVYVLLIPSLIWLPDFINPPISKSFELSERYGGEWQGTDEVAIPLTQPGFFNKNLPILESYYLAERIYRLTPAIKHQKDGVSLVVQKLMLTLEEDGIEIDWEKSTHWEINGRPGPGFISYVTSIPMPIPPGNARVSVTSPLAFKLKAARKYHVSYVVIGKLDNGQGIRPIRGAFVVRFK